MPGVKLSLPMGRIVEEQFETYIRHLYPPGIPDVQRAELRKTFFAGVTIVLSMLEMIGESEDITEETGGEILESLRDECIRFAEGLAPNADKPFIWTPNTSH